MGKNMMKPRKGLSEKEKHSSQCENFFFLTFRSHYAEQFLPLRSGRRCSSYAKTREPQAKV